MVVVVVAMVRGGCEWNDSGNGDGEGDCEASDGNIVLRGYVIGSESIKWVCDW